MTKYAFFSFPAYGHVNPTLAIVQELIAHGEEVILSSVRPLARDAKGIEASPCLGLGR